MSEGERGAPEGRAARPGGGRRLVMVSYAGALALIDLSRLTGADAARCTVGGARSDRFRCLLTRAKSYSCCCAWTTSFAAPWMSMSAASDGASLRDADRRRRAHARRARCGEPRGAAGARRGRRCCSRHGTRRSRRRTDRILERVYAPCVRCSIGAARADARLRSRIRRRPHRSRRGIRARVAGSAHERSTESWAFTLYHADGALWPFFRTLAARRRPGARCVRYDVREALRYTALCRYYPSQRRTWLGLVPEAAARRVLLRREWVNPIDGTRLKERPHDGVLLYGGCSARATTASPHVLRRSSQAPEH